MSLILLPLIALLTSVVSAVIGMGGGVLLISIMTFFLPYQIIIPIHGVVQFISNGSRGLFLIKHVRWRFVQFFLIGAPFGYWVAYYVLKNFTSPNFYYLMLACFILYTVFKPKKLPQIKLKTLGWTVLGFFAAIQGSLLGASGPLIAPFYVRDDLKKEEIIATKAMQQIFIHMFKIPLFIQLEFDYLEYSALIILMSAGALLGSALGVKILGKVSESIFKKLFKTVLVIAAARLIYKFGVGI
ncbi:MAG: hypothetical protein CME62_04975 [Halobacteriovoraceae bacterium]|nr:hypothetical protein [Halobacteriovoraceae bacterium]|tara:strand:- start:2146 stop:2871 length:726 start_codon:yes stop_codon:yes gene_type:complete